MARINKAQKEAIKNDIVKNARQMFKENGYDGTSTAKIAKAVGIAEGTLFNYFKTKTELFLAIMSEDYFEINNPECLAYDSNKSIVEIIYDYSINTIDKMLKMPKKLLLEIVYAMMGAAKKKPEMIRKLIELDFKFIEYLTELIQELMNKNLMKNDDARVVAEMIYSFLIYEVIIYLYEKDFEKQKAYSAFKGKLERVIKLYEIEVV